MRAALCPGYGDPEVVEVVDRPAPESGAGTVRVRVEAAAVNFPDVLLIANKYQVSAPPPFTPGSEFAGRVAAAGEGVTGLAAGDLNFYRYVGDDPINATDPSGLGEIDVKGEPDKDWLYFD